ncbi:MFS transporter, partial [Herbaspirillum sp. B65]|uniref:MFS transporter n=1 Tax=Herbaspirillum sp. B65 TaxID=137708 RepID=UPI0005CA1F4D
MALHTDAAHSSGQVLPFRESLLATLGICFVIMLVALDQTIVGTALPTIVAELKGFELYAWVATAYLLTSVITVPIFGRLGDYFGRKPFVIASIIVFVGASALCGMANSMLFLVLARGLQGIGGGMLVGTCFASIADLFPDPRVRLRWQVILSASFGIATAVGPSLGGFLTEGLGWRWVFYCNLPVGVISLFFVWRFVPHIRHMHHAGKMRLDWPGALLISLSLGSLQLLLELLPKRGITGGMMALLALSVAAFYALWKWEQRAAQAILPVEMLRDRALASLFLLSLLAGFAMFSLLMYAPLLFQGGFGLSPREAGLLITPLVACITVASIVNGRLITRIPNPNLMMNLGFALIAASCLGVVLSDRNTGNGFLLSVMLAGGFGLGLVLPNLTVLPSSV